MNNWDRVNKGFDTLLRALVKYEVHELAAHYGMQNWWNEGILPILSPEQARNVANADSDQDRILSLDVAIVLSIIDRRWGDVFRRRLPRDCRTWAIELKGVRNAFAHRGVQDMNDDDAYRALDTMQRLCTELDSEKAEPSVRSCEKCAMEATAVLPLQWSRPGIRWLRARPLHRSPRKIFPAGVRS